jgi:TRAP-type mannitol/chloroaromatic compound transport system permease small subunit
LEKLIRGIEKVSDWSGKVAALMIVPMILVIVYTAFMRYVLNDTPNWGFEISIFVYGIHFILGGAYTLKEKSHVSVDILPHYLTIKWRRILEIFAMIITFAVCIIIFWLGVKYSWQSTKIWEHSMHQTAFNPPIWWFKWFIPISAGLVALQAIASLLREIIKKGE